MRIISVICCPRQLPSHLCQCQRLLLSVLLIAFPSVGRSDDDLKSIAKFEKPDADPYSLSFPISSIRFSPDGERVALCGNALTGSTGEGEVALLRSPEMATLRMLPLGGVFLLDFSSDGRLLALGGVHNAAIWRIEEGVLDILDEEPLNPPIPSIGGDCYVRFMRKDGRLLLLDGQGSGMYFWSIRHRRMELGKRTNDPELESFRKMDVSPDEEFVAVGCGARAAGVFRLEPGGLGELLWRRPGNFENASQFQDKVFCIKFSPDGKRLGILNSEGLTGSRSLELWMRQGAGNEVSDWKLEGTLGGEDNDQDFEIGHSFAFSPDGKYIAVCGSEEAGVGIYEVGERRLVLRLQYTAWSFHPVDPDFAAALAPLDADADNSDSVVARGNRPFVKALAFSPDGKVLLTGYESGEVALWQFQSKLAEIQAQ